MNSTLISRFQSEAYSESLSAFSGLHDSIGPLFAVNSGQKHRYAQSVVRGGCAQWSAVSSTVGSQPNDPHCLFAQGVATCFYPVGGTVSTQKAISFIDDDDFDNDDFEDEDEFDLDEIDKLADLGDIEDLDEVDEPGYEDDFDEFDEEDLDDDDDEP